MAKKLVCVAEHELAWQEYQDAPLGPGQVKIKAVYAAAKHGTEMAFYKGYANPRGPWDNDLLVHHPEQAAGSGYPFHIGNMVVGPVVEVGEGVTKVAVGDRVCTYSGFAETRVIHEDRCWLMPEGMPWQSAVCLDPAEFAFAAVRDGHIRLGDGVAIFGLGAIGLMVLQFAKLAGAYPIIALDPIANRREIAQELGATLTLDPTACDAGLEIKKATANRGADVIVDYAGARQSLQAALRGVAYGGTVVCGAFPPPYGAGLDFGAESHMNVPNIVFTRACSTPLRDHPRWTEQRIFENCWWLLASGAVTGEPIVHPVVPMAELEDAYAKIATDPVNYLKLGVKY